MLTSRSLRLAILGVLSNVCGKKVLLTPAEFDALVEFSVEYRLSLALELERRKQASGEEVEE